MCLSSQVCRTRRLPSHAAPSRMTCPAGTHPLCKSRNDDFEVRIPAIWNAPSEVSRKRRRSTKTKEVVVVPDQQEGADEMYCHKTRSWIPNTRGTKLQSDCYLLSSTPSPTRAIIPKRKKKRKVKKISKKMDS